MKKILLVCAFGLLNTPAFAATIERACNKSPRNPTPALCSCIQNSADIKLSRRDQSFAATFFSDPHRSQETRQSDNPEKEAFWLRYKAFGAHAQQHCRGIGRTS